MLKRLDLFPASQFIRYRKETEFKTAFGGFMSMVIIAVMVALFTNMSLQTLSKSLITASMAYEIEADPSEVSFKAGKAGGFMFEIYMGGVNLSNSSFRAFDVNLYEATYTPYFKEVNRTSIPLSQCTRDHFDFN